MKILEKQPYTQEQIERETLEILALGFDIPMKVMGFEENETEWNNNSKLTKCFRKSDLKFEYKIMLDSEGYFFIWEIFDKTQISPTNYMAQISPTNYLAQIVQFMAQGMQSYNTSRKGISETFEGCIDYIAEQIPIIKQKIKEQKSRRAA